MNYLRLELTELLSDEKETLTAGTLSYGISILNVARRNSELRNFSEQSIRTADNCS